MHTALRPYLTSGIAIVGASVIAVAPVAVPPPPLPTVEVTAADALQSVTADVELTASFVDLIAAVPQVAALVLELALQPLPLPPQLKTLAIELVKAGTPAITETVKLWTETLPTTALGLISAGKFAHLVPLAANTVYAGILTPIAPFAVALMNALPLPLGTQDGVLNEFLKLTIQTPFLAGATVLSLLAEVIDDGLSPVDAFVGMIGALSTAVTSAVGSLEKIAATLGGALPISALAAPEGLGGARTMATASDMPALNEPKVIVSQANPPTPAAAADALTLTVESSALQDVNDTGLPPAEARSDDQSAEEDSTHGEPSKAADEDVTPNGATDLSDGNMAEPGGVNHGSAGTDSDDSTSAAEKDTTSQGAVANQTATTADSSSGSNDGSGGDGQSSESE